jgi:hypothetical protein
MKTIFQLSTFLLFVTILLQACTKVSEPYYSVKSVYVDTTRRSILLEDYTGHLCVNCAPASKTANSLQELYEGQVFVIAVHAGDFAKPNSDPRYVPYLLSDYTCETGNEWNSYSGFEIEAWGYPRGLINRRYYKGSISFGPTDWNQAIQASIGLPKVAIMTVNNTYNSQTKVLNSKVDMKFLINYSGKVNLTVCLLEDSIYGGQLNSIKPDSTPIIKNFRFMHMLRGSLNGTFGEEITVNPQSGNILTKTYSFPFTGTDFKVAHCNVIAFISDGDTKEVLHVAKSSDIKP